TACACTWSTETAKSMTTLSTCTLRLIRQHRPLSFYRQRLRSSWSKRHRCNGPRLKRTTL
ncbi:hypothetical protein H4S00_004942, partial [Coemansia sp. D1744]